ncbi:MAG: PatB family C-S lyase [Bacteroidales bacterium]|nr:PatB family C-S lyase [Bacteroidales bacterium]MDD3811913.1 PatB family C-S lyase [Bacteroidales bacterium]NLO67108.1 putative C-S lyase [Bacteroidales bacterium]
MAGKRFTQADFDRITDRQGTNSIKWDARDQVFGNPDVVPLWVADMDFETPAFIRERIARRLEHPILGYTYRSERFAGSFISWVNRRHHWEVDPEWVVFMPGVVPAVSVAVLAYTDPGDEVIIQPPVYHPFYFCVEGHNRKLILNPLKTINGRFTFDLELLRQQITPKTRLLILSNPHNPGGTAWSAEELASLAAICQETGVRILSDEIHSDLTYPPGHHTPAVTAAPNYAHRIITAMAPSKTFNMAGMSTSILVIPDPKERKTYADLVYTLHVGMGNVFGFEALQAAYEEGDQWLDELLTYLKGNRDYLHQFLQAELPMITMMVPDATYLAWLDFRGLGLEQKALEDFLVTKASIGLNIGKQFGPGGEGFMRLNFGCPRSLLQQALTQLKEAVNNL